MSASVLLLAMCVSAYQPHLDCRLDARGVVTQVEAGSCVFLTGASVGLIAPDWQGSQGDQRALEPKAVQVTEPAGETAYSSVLEGKAGRTRLRRASRKPAAEQSR